MMAAKLERTIRLARLALMWEAIWAAAFPALLTIAVFLLAVLSGLLAAFPDMVRFTALGLFALFALSARKRGDSRWNEALLLGFAALLVAAAFIAFSDVLVGRLQSRGLVY